jgi:hypothetical protein
MYPSPNPLHFGLMYPSPNPLPYFVRKGAISLYIKAIPFLAKQGGGNKSAYNIDI